MGAIIEFPLPRAVFDHLAYLLQRNPVDNRSLFVATRVKKKKQFYMQMQLYSYAILLASHQMFITP